METRITWENFKTFNQDSKGIQLKFEDLCRQLFINENLSCNQKYRYVHSNPNNPGLETEPIYDEKNNRWIGFQVKYFESQIDYNQILESAKNIVKYYVNKVNHVFLFCNKSISSQAKKFKETQNILISANITLELITDTAILDLVRKYSYLGLYYFGNHIIDQKWLENHNKSMFDALGIRYNQNFNIDTKISKQLSLFLIDQESINYINEKKITLIEKIQEKYQNYSYHDYNNYLHVLENSVKKLPDIDEKNILDAIGWKKNIETDTNEYRTKIINERKKLLIKIEKQNEMMRKNSYNSNEQIKIREQYSNLQQNIRYLNVLLTLSDMLEISDEEQSILNGNILLIDGKAGTGKSQLLADKTNKLLLNNKKALLLLGEMFLDETPIQEQITKNLSLNYDFYELIDILEVDGETTGNIIPIFIDALNETWIHKLWKNELPKIITKIKNSPMLKLILTYRSEYEKELLPDNITIKIQNGEILNLHHYGFIDNSTTAIIQFLNHFNIPFTPSTFLENEMSNPLFLTLYCKTYNGETVNLPELYDRLIANVNINICKVLKSNPNYREYTIDDNIISPLIEELSLKLVENNIRNISKEDFCNLNYWHNYGLKPAIFARLLIKERIIHNIFHNNKEYLYFAYDQMNDYYCAKAIFQKYNEKSDIRKYLCEKVLTIKNGNLQNPGNIDLFINSCALYADKYHEECIDIIDTLTDEDKEMIFSQYIKSFQWRNRENIPVVQFQDLLLKYPLKVNVIWEMFICNSVKILHPLNANYLHELLLKFKLNKRDNLWTIYINEFTSKKMNRIVQLIKMYNNGDKLEIDKPKQIELLLTLLSWFLTSSNRWLRDYTSKAMIEILKENFVLCLKVLKKFESVNDPYVIQRLYGIVFGACCKRKTSEDNIFQELVIYVYNTIFNHKTVYPDILLRDYARLIIERYLFEYPNNKNLFEYNKIIPPYNSEPIPDIEEKNYLNENYSSGISRIVQSMTFEGMNLDGIGLYGDFGRYVFQSKIRDFEVDHRKIFNYAIHYILNNLEYSNDLFEANDYNCGDYSGYGSNKIERIGKKYQWIAMYNILARISDHCKMLDRYSSLIDKEIKYEGAWNPYVRDFDPTLNINFIKYIELPRFKSIDDFIEKVQMENKTANISTAKKQTNWLKSEGIFFHKLKDILLLTDDNNTKWVSLTQYCDTNRNNIEIDKLFIWSWAYAYFVTPEQEIALTKYFQKGYSIINYEIATRHETYTIYNREYPWSPSCKEFEEYAWVDAKIKTNKSEIITISLPKINIIDDINDTDKIAYESMSYRKNIEENIGKILHSTTNLIWEEEYDASKDHAISYEIPCAKLIKDLNLKQMETDGLYYDIEGKLSAFSTKTVQNIGGVVIRKDLLDIFLRKNNFKLIWFVRIQKRIYNQNGDFSNFSEWESIFSYSTKNIKGKIRNIEDNHI